jgi:hypothetical protein
VGNGVFAGGFAFFGAQNVVKCVVERGGTVVKTWLETTANRRTKICQKNAQNFGFLCAGALPDPYMGSPTNLRP